MNGLRGQLRILFDRGQRRRMTWVLLGVLSAALLEMVAIASIPAFVVLLNDPERVLSVLNETIFGPWIQTMGTATISFVAACLLALLFLSKNLYLAGIIYAEAAIQRDVAEAISNRLFIGYLASPYTFHLQRNPAQLVRNISWEVSETIKVIRSGMAVVREGLVLIVIFVLFLMIDPLVSLSVFALVGATASAFYFAVRRTLAERGALAQAHRGRQVQIVNQGLGAIKDAKILGCELFLAKLFQHETSGKERHELYKNVVEGLPRLVLEVAGVAALVAVAAVAVIFDRPPESMLPVLALLAVSVVRLVPACNTITRSLTNIRYSQASFDLTCSELDMVGNADRSKLDRGPKRDGQPKLQHEIVLDDLHFRYPGQLQDALRGVSLAIRAGEAVAFIGPSGAGKSTLVDLILGLLTPTSGEIRVDGEGIQERLSDWQRQVGYIPQDIYLIDDSIRRNVAFGMEDDEIDEAAIARALKTAQLDIFVGNLPQGLDTRVGNRGVRLSGGQRQRIGIARALYHQPRVLVMDEATSALDHETERAVIEAIARIRGSHTIIMIAHRMTTVMTCDRLYLLSDGEVKDAGRYQELALRHEHLRVPAESVPKLSIA